MVFPANSGMNLAAISFAKMGNAFYCTPLQKKDKTHRDRCVYRVCPGFFFDTYIYDTTIILFFGVVLNKLTPPMLFIPLTQLVGYGDVYFV